MSKHTPGPWVFEVRDSGTFRIRMGTALESPGHHEAQHTIEWDTSLYPEDGDQYEEAVMAPLHWRRPRRIFVNSMSDLFHENVPDEWIDQIFAVMARAHWHTFQVLTKRPERMLNWCMRAALTGRVSQDLVDAAQGRWPLPNVWLGVSVEDQRAADERIPFLLQTPAAVRWLSMEPLLGPVDLTPWLGDLYYCDNPRHGQLCPDGILRDGDTIICRYCKRPVDVVKLIDWVVVGGESGPGARPMHPDWVRSIRDQCLAAGVPFFFKQWGEYCYPSQMPSDTYRALDCWEPNPPEKPFRTGKKRAGALLDGREWREWPVAAIAKAKGEG